MKNRMSREARHELAKARHEKREEIIAKREENRKKYEILHVEHLKNKKVEEKYGKETYSRFEEAKKADNELRKLHEEALAVLESSTSTSSRQLKPLVLRAIELRKEEEARLEEEIKIGQMWGELNESNDEIRDEKFELVVKGNLLQMEKDLLMEDKESLKKHMAEAKRNKDLHERDSRLIEKHVNAVREAERDLKVMEGMPRM